MTGPFDFAGNSLKVGDYILTTVRHESNTMCVLRIAGITPTGWLKFLPIPGRSWWRSQLQAPVDCILISEDQAKAIAKKHGYEL